MNTNIFRDTSFTILRLNGIQRKALLIVVFMLTAKLISAQKINSSVDSTSVKIGQQITYAIEVEVDTSSLVVFPEGQTFLPLEMIESYKVDATKFDDRFRLIKKYGLTQFDSGKYTIPRQKILIGDYEFFTDSVLVEVRSIAVDTTKQPLYDIKPINEVDKSASKWWLYVLLTLMALALVAYLIYWFIWREKPLTEDEKVAMLPPYERAKLALVELDKTSYLENSELKAYYSELTGIIRTYLDEKVYDRALESTTEELISRLHLLSDGNQIDLSKSDIANIDTILKRADLVKFAKSKPDVALAQLDRQTIDVEIDHVKEALPEPTEEELLADIRYQEELAQKKKRRKIIITAVVSAVLLVGTFIGFSAHYGLRYVKDSIFGHPSKELLEGKEWVTSEYGAPGVIITTPKVLERQKVDLPDNLQGKMEVANFTFGTIASGLEIIVTSTKLPETEPQDGMQDEKTNPEEESGKLLLRRAEARLNSLEAIGAQNIITKNEQFITPNGQEGLKTFGTADFEISSGNTEKGEYIILGFTTERLLQEVVLLWQKDDVYAQDIMDRVINSIELIKLQEEE